MTAGALLAALAREFGVSEDELTGIDRRRPLAMMRAVAIETVRQHSQMSYPSLAALFRRLDHTTAMNACRMAPRYRAKNPELGRAVARALGGYRWAAELVVEGLEMAA